MGQVESQLKVIEINSKDLEENKVSLADLNEKSKTSLLSLNIKKNYESKSKYKRKKKIDFEFVEPFIDLEDIEVGQKYFEKDYSKYEEYFKGELDRINMIFHPKFDPLEMAEKNNNEINVVSKEKRRKDIEKYFFENFESANALNSTAEDKKTVNKSLKSKSVKNKALVLKPAKRLELDHLAELDKIEKEFDKEKLDLKDPQFINSMNLLILKYENVSISLSNII